MTRSRITMLASHEERLRIYLESHPLGHERGAVVLFRRLDLHLSGLEDSDRYLAIDVVPFKDLWITSSSASHVAFDLKYLRDLFRRCADESLVFGFAHNHPAGPSEFSVIDTANEETLIAAISNRNGTQSHIVALLWSQGRWKARVRSGSSPQQSLPSRHVMVVDRPVRIFTSEKSVVDDDLTARQAAAFGKPFVTQMQSLRVAVVGAGGTGSSTIELLARAGVGEIVAIDGDNLERSNLNRVRGSRTTDVGKNKAKVAKKFVDNMKLPVRTVAIPKYIDLEPIAIDALASCDVVFGCTDDQIGREVLNAALYMYAQPFIDVGLGGQVSEDATGRPQLRYHFGRVSTILPEIGECLFCQGILKDVWIRHQYAMRQNPHLSKEEARERYIDGGGEQAPGVGPFTSAVADYGVATLFDLIQPFRRLPPEVRHDYFTIDFVRMAIRSHQEKADPECMYCRQHAYLLSTEEYRLNRPALGKRRART